MIAKLVDAFMKDREFAERHLRETGSVRPQFVIRPHGNKEPMVLMTIGIDRADSYKMLRLLAIAHDALAVTVISEAWALTGDAAESVVSPKDSERRIEALVVMTTTRDEGQASLREIMRDGEGKVTGLGVEMAGGAVNDMGGEIAHVVPRTRPGAEARVLAQLLLDAMKAPRADA